MLSVRLARLSVSRPGCRALGTSLQAKNSHDKTGETSDSNSEATVPRTLNMFGESEGLSEEEIEAKRNISRMSRRMYNRKIRGVYEASHANDFKVKQLRKDFVQFGAASGINGGVCWPTKQEIADLHFIEGEFRSTFFQMKEKLETNQKIMADRREAREKEIEANLSKLAVWRKEIADKEEKKRQEELAQKAIMDERIREVREYIGYNVEPSDPKFVEIMEMKQAERKEAAKQARKLAKKERMMRNLLNINLAQTGNAESAAEAPTGKEDPSKGQADTDKQSTEEKSTKEN